MSVSNGHYTVLYNRQIHNPQRRLSPLLHSEPGYFFIDSLAAFIFQLWSLKVGLQFFSLLPHNSTCLKQGGIRGPVNKLLRNLSLLVLIW